MTPRGLLKFIVPLAAFGTAAAGQASGEWASRGGHVVLPESSIEQPEHVGLRAHTNFKMFMPNAGMAARPPDLTRSRTSGQRAALQRVFLRDTGIACLRL